MLKNGTRSALRDFLIERRSRLTRAAVGLPAARGSNGLSQADVARLAGISLNWYELLESGRDDRRVSAHCVDAVAQALRLNETERHELFRLALRQSDAAARLAESMQESGAERLHVIRDVSRKFASATDMHEVAMVAAQALHGITMAHAATVVTLHDGSGTTGFAIGPNARRVGNGFHEVAWHSRRRMASGQVTLNQGERSPSELLRAPVLSDIRVSGDEIATLSQWQWTPELYRETVYPTRGRSALTLPLIAASRLRGLITLVWTEPRMFSRLEVETAKTIASLVELVTAKSH